MILSIKELNEQAKNLINTHFDGIEVRGEILKFTAHSSGHWYFTLSDENQKHSIDCVMFGFYNKASGLAPKIGDKVVIYGMADLYVANARFQINVKKMRPDGDGELAIYLKNLIAKLSKEGLLDPAHKKPLPKFPRRVAIITSTTSAAYEDLKKRISLRWGLCDFDIYNSLMQGEMAVDSIVLNLSIADKKGYDLIIIARGGGSRDDLWCFNDESLARAVFAAKTPILSAIGHESDTSLLDLVSDHSSSTPTAAIEDALPDINTIRQDLDLKKDRLDRAITLCFSRYTNLLEVLKHRVKNQNLSSKILLLEQKIQILKNQSKFLILGIFSQKKSQLDKSAIMLSEQKRFLQISKNLIQIRKDGNFVNLKSLKSGDEVSLISQTATKIATIK
ncbi:MAG: exodeoxyribonuclease VII large subunit [Campylobacter sp.]|nr:exodeoxyribonuclease VII large subunit [Campylobacter sp.]